MVKKNKKRKKNRSPNRVPLLSVCMIVRNEEKHLPGCLDSIAGLWDELIVVDTGSEDGTVEIARRYGAKVFHFPWQDDFSAARNVSLQHATGRWLLWLDADDRIYRDQHAKIRKLAQMPPEQCYYFILENQGVDQSRCLQLRMVPNHPKMRFERPIHEQLAPAARRLGLPLQETDVVLSHTGYSSPDVLKKKKKRYLKLMAKWLANNPDDNYIRYQYALTLHTTDHHQEAVREFQKLIHSPGFKQENELLYLFSKIMLGRCYLNLKLLDKAEAILESARELNPANEFLLISLAEVLVMQQKFTEALDILKGMNGEFGNHLTAMALDYSILEYGYYLYLGRCYFHTGQIQNALQALQTAVELKPNKTSAMEELGKVWRMVGDYEQSEKILQKAITLEPENDELYFYLGQTYFDAGFLGQAYEAFQKSLSLNSKRDETRMNLALVERNRGHFQRALELLDSLQNRSKKFKDYQFQRALTLWDAKEFAKLEQSVPLIADSFQKKILTALVELKKGNQKNVASLWNLPENDSAQELKAFLQQKIQDYLAQNESLTAELIAQIRALLFRQSEFLLSLAELQIRNRRLFQAIDTLEQVVALQSDPDACKTFLATIAQCYRMIGSQEAFRYFKDNMGAVAVNQDRILVQE